MKTLLKTLPILLLTSCASLQSLQDATGDYVEAKAVVDTSEAVPAGKDLIIVPIKAVKPFLAPKLPEPPSITPEK